MKLYYYYLKNLIENQLDNFFSYFYVDTVLEIFTLRGGFSDVLDLIKYLFSFRFEEFLFFLKNSISSYNKRNSYLFYFIFLLSDLFSFFSFFLLSHGWLSLKIYDDYVHNYSRRKVLKVFAMFFLLFSLIFILFYFFIL
jgi:succinate dehydrogenase hydrophobic anchor subunit